MLEIQKLRKNTSMIVQALKARNVPDAGEQVEKILQLDQQRRKNQVELDQMKQEMNQASKSIGMLMKQGKREEAEAIKQRVSELKTRIKELEQYQRQTEAALEQHLWNLPNVSHSSVPVGRDESANEVVYKSDRKVAFDFEPRPHWELARMHDLIDWELGSKITGAGFPVYKGKGARLQRALIAYFLDRAVAEGYTEIQPPLLVNEASGFGTGQLPDKDGQMYTVERDGLYLIPTAEVPITNLYRNDILQADQLPVKNCGYTPCFRREAGSYGKDVKGLNRLHQFDKVELVQIVDPQTSYEVLEEMIAYVRGLLDSLELPYRQLNLCTGDLGFTSAKTYDLEVFSAGQGRWLEVSSVSNFESYQTNRMKLRYRDEQNKIHLAHSLNGSALALPRIVAALLENFQQADGSIGIPAVLQPYTGFERIG
ncbi:MAG: serine--tRNA ligase [Bacteroidetes bacterium]|nr:MAG: serine--tRNA ligase [Bacteroidota bacterium]